MDSEPLLLRLLFFWVLILLSAFFSGSEAAFFSLSKEMLDGLKESSSKKSNLIAKLLKKPRHLLITILVGNTIINVSAASVAAILTADISLHFQFPKSLAIFSEVIVVTLILIVFSELTPKVFAIKNPYKFAAFTSIPLTAFRFILYPIVITFRLYFLNFLPGELRSIIYQKKN